MTRIYIIRHGETEWNRLGKTQGSRDISLSEAGRAQALRLAERLSGEGICTLYSSDLKRAMETAACIGQRIGAAPIPTPALREASFGCWEGMTVQEIEETYPGSLKAWRTEYTSCPSGGESVEAFTQRVSRFLPELREHLKQTSGNVLIVSHGITSRVLLLLLLDMPLTYLWHFRQDNTGVNIVEVDGHRSVLNCLNDTCHLSEHALIGSSGLQKARGN